MNLKRHLSHERGMVLVVTVLVLSVLIVLGYTFSYSAGVNLSAARNARSEMVEQFGSESALSYAVGLLRTNALESKVDTLDDTWAQEQILVEIAGKEYAVNIVDENRKLNVNLAVAVPTDIENSFALSPVLRRLVLQAGGREQDYDVLVRGVDPTRPLPLITALRGLPGIDMNLFSRDRELPALDALLATHPKRININTASESLLNALWYDPELTRSVLMRREASAFRNEPDLEAFLKDYLSEEEANDILTVLDVRSNYFTISVVPVVAGVVWELTALVSRDGDNVSILSAQRVLKEPLPCDDY